MREKNPLLYRIKEYIYMLWKRSIHRKVSRGDFFSKQCEIAYPVAQKYIVSVYLQSRFSLLYVKDNVQKNPPSLEKNIFRLLIKLFNLFLLTISAIKVILRTFQKMYRFFSRWLSDSVTNDSVTIQQTMRVILSLLKLRKITRKYWKIENHIQ